MAVKIKLKDNQKLGEAIYRNGYSVQSFARESNLSDTTIQSLIDGSRNGCGPTTAQRILKTLESSGVKFDDLFFIHYSSKSKNEEETATLAATGTEGK